VTLVVISLTLKLRCSLASGSCSVGLSVGNFAANFSEVRVKVHAQIRLSENLPLVIARPWLKKTLPNLAIRKEVLKYIISA